MSKGHPISRGAPISSPTQCIMLPGHSRFETGHPKVDEEHQEFFRQVTALRTPVDAGAGRERTVELIKNLQRCVLGHFPR